MQFKQRNLKIKKEIELYSAEKAHKKKELEDKIKQDVLNKKKQEQAQE